MKPTKTESTEVIRDPQGRIRKGSAAMNGGGLTTEQRTARDALNRWLCDAPQVEKGKKAYLKLLGDGNPVIVKDFMDRVAGKVKESVEVTTDGAAPEWLSGLTAAAVLAIARGEKPE